jgi:hypothetical protein
MVRIDEQLAHGAGYGTPQREGDEDGHCCNNGGLSADDITELAPEDDAACFLSVMDEL